MAFTWESWSFAQRASLELFEPLAACTCEHQKDFQEQRSWDMSISQRQGRVSRARGIAMNEHSAQSPSVHMVDDGCLGGFDVTIRFSELG